MTDPGSGEVRDKQQALLAEIISKVNDLFEGELTDDDKLIYVNYVIKGKLMESEILAEQAADNTKEQFANSPDLANEILSAIMNALEAHAAMSKLALESEKVRHELRDIQLDHASLYEDLRIKWTINPAP
jgi:type I restriction enzyme R subunit